MMDKYNLTVGQGFSILEPVPVSMKISGNGEYYRVEDVDAELELLNNMPAKLTEMTQVIAELRAGAKHRYSLFGSEDFYYAKGGMNDFIADSNNVDELIQNAAKERINKYSEYPYVLDWWHIYDWVENKIVLGTEEQAYGAETLEGSQVYNTEAAGVE